MWILLKYCRFNLQCNPLGRLLPNFARLLFIQRMLNTKQLSKIVAGALKTSFMIYVDLGFTQVWSEQVCVYSCDAYSHFSMQRCCIGLQPGAYLFIWTRALNENKANGIMELVTHVHKHRPNFKTQSSGHAYNTCNRSDLIKMPYHSHRYSNGCDRIDPLT